MILKDTRYEITKDGVQAVTDLSKSLDNRLREYMKSRIKVAELNGGALFEVATILGKPLYVRLDHHDLERAKAELKEVQSLVKSVVLLGDD